MPAKDDLWPMAELQHGYVTAAQSQELGIDTMTMQMLVRRGTLERAAHGVYRFPQFPYTDATPYMLAVLWTRMPEACLSHETALAVYDICDINPNRTHLTVGRHRRIRRANDAGYVIHHDDLTAQQIGWWQEVPTVTPATAIAQCIAYGTGTYLLTQAIENGRTQGRLTSAQHDDLTQRLEQRNARQHP